MKVVTCYKAAQIAQVKKQGISRKKLDNEKNKGKYPYFGYDKDSGDFGIDIDHPSWISYMETRRSNPMFDHALERRVMEEMKLSVIDHEQEKNTLFFAVIDSCTESVKELFNPSEKKIGELNDLIMEKFGEKMG